MQVAESEYLAHFQEEIDRITQPLVDQYKALDREVKQREAEVSEMKKARTQLRQMIRAINPDLIESPYKKNGKNGKKSYAFSDEKLGKFENWIREHAEQINAQGGVHASGLVNSKGEVVFDGFDLPGFSQTQISKAFVALHDKGVVRLDHLGNGGSKFFKVQVES